MAKKAILFTNLGSPDSPEVKDVKNYLNEFLMDGKVIDIPLFLRFLLVKGIIAPIRAKSSAKKYKTIWTEKGSPLIYTTEELTQLVSAHTGLPGYMCMRYANPTPHAALKQVERDNPDLEELVLFPLYPHYAMSSYETGVDYVKEAYSQRQAPYTLKVVPPYYKDKNYIASLSQSIEPFLQHDYDLILFSYHGIPERHLKKSDPTKAHCLSSKDCCESPSEAHKVCYRHQVIETTKRVAKKLNIPSNKYRLSFQSRLGPDPWLTPYTSKMLKTLPSEGIKKIIVVTPAFVSDCLETLEEISMEGQEIFKENGGEQFTVVPCLNTNASWVKAIGQLLDTAARPLLCHTST